MKVSTLPLTMEDVDKFENMLKKCGRSYKGEIPSVDPIEYETYYDPDQVCLRSFIHYGARASLIILTVAFGN